MKNHSHTPVPCEHEDEERYKFSVTYRGETLEIEGQGAGPIDAFVHAIRDRFSLACDILDYHEHANSKQTTLPKHRDTP
jgi:2-isopropylmalate synthase